MDIATYNMNRQTVYTDLYWQTAISLHREIKESGGSFIHNCNGTMVNKTSNVLLGRHGKILHAQHDKM